MKRVYFVKKDESSTPKSQHGTSKKHSHHIYEPKTKVYSEKIVIKPENEPDVQKSLSASQEIVAMIKPHSPSSMNSQLLS